MQLLAATRRFSEPGAQSNRPRSSPHAACPPLRRRTRPRYPPCPQAIAGASERHCRYKERGQERLMADGPTAALDAEPNALPHNIEAEQALLGALLVNNDVYDSVAATVQAAHF